MHRIALVSAAVALPLDAGETALIYFDGAPSHAIRKGPLLRLGDGLVAGLFAPEQITARGPAVDERELAAAAHAALPFATPLYARIDMIRAAGGEPVVLELELTEPSVFLAHAPGSAGRLARHSHPHRLTRGPDRPELRQPGSLSRRRWRALSLARRALLPAGPYGVMSR